MLQCCDIYSLLDNSLCIRLFRPISFIVFLFVVVHSYILNCNFPLEIVITALFFIILSIFYVEKNLWNSDMIRQSMTTSIRY